MIGAIAGDIIGSVYETHNIKTTDFPLFCEASTFTDDTVLTVALADSILHEADFTDKLKEYYNLYPNAGYGAGFIQWASSSTRAQLPPPRQLQPVSSVVNPPLPKTLGGTASATGGSIMPGSITVSSTVSQ